MADMMLRMMKGGCSPIVSSVTAVARRRYRERVEQVWWAPEEIQQTLREAGFDKIRSGDAGEIEIEGLGPSGYPKGLNTF